MSQAVLEALQSEFGDEVVLETHAHRGDETAIIAPDKIRDVATWLKAEQAFEMFTDVTCVDWLDEREGYRFEVVYHLYSMSQGHRLRLKCRLDGEAPSLPSLVPVWKGADWFEREAYDMYGVTFDDHPDLRRILMYPEFVGHPLRKDYPLAGEQPLVEMRDPDSGRPVMPQVQSDLVRLRSSQDPANASVPMQGPMQDPEQDEEASS